MKRLGGIGERGRCTLHMHMHFLQTLSGPHIPCSPQQSTEPVHSSLWPSCGTQLQRLQEEEEEEEMIGFV